MRPWVRAAPSRCLGAGRARARGALPSCIGQGAGPLWAGCPVCQVARCMSAGRLVAGAGCRGRGAPWRMGGGYRAGGREVVATPAIFYAPRPLLLVQGYEYQGRPPLAPPPTPRTTTGATPPGPPGHPGQGVACGHARRRATERRVRRTGRTPGFERSEKHPGRRPTTTALWEGGVGGVVTRAITRITRGLGTDTCAGTSYMAGITNFTTFLRKRYRYIWDGVLLTRYTHIHV